ncbi:thiosulfate reductase cytochrome B subunit [Musicola paradisiaca]|uniref:Cytochrome B561 n=1 Tax=Musicola paradisiaca (strain Ech703) TaxID=579405 RepID=C6C7I2_MUSP7|nr:thiosulfate reductase cytochrome B subunit [Musicola paradisiaca]ACS84100.1 cytochrome B561 [Musicola paradisiaca Ech703]
MNTLPHAEQFQAQLAGYVTRYTPDHWPTLLILAGLALAGMLGVLALHGVLRYRFARPHPAGHEEKIYLYSGAVRLWHWSNALLFLLLLLSGAINHFALASPDDTARLVSLHALCGYLLLADWLLFVSINALGGNGRHYVIEPQGWKPRAMKQVRFYLYGIIRGEDHPFPATRHCKFNPLQQAAYLGVMYGLLPLLLLTGVLLQHPEWLPAALSPYWLLQLHALLAVVSVFFIVGHLYLCTTGRTPTQTFRSMIDGYHRH